MDRYMRYMKKKRPSAEFLNELEYAMIDSWRKEKRIRLAQKYVAATTVLVFLLIGIAYIAMPDYDDVIVPSQSVLSSGEADLQNGEAVMTDIRNGPYLALTISDVTIPEPNVGTYYLYGSLVAGVNQNIDTSIFAEANNDSAILMTLKAGDCCWIYDVNAGNVNGLTKVRFWDEKKRHMNAGWIQIDDSCVEGSLDGELLRPGWLAGDSGVLRYGRDDNADVVCDLSERQQLYLIVRNGNWVLASTAPFSQINDIEHMPEIGWIRVEEVVASSWAVYDRSVTIISDSAHIYDRPNGEVCCVVPAVYGDNLRYEDEILSVYGEKWYRVSYMNIETSQERVYGYILDSQVKLNAHYEEYGGESNQRGAIAKIVICNDDRDMMFSAKCRTYRS